MAVVISSDLVLNQQSLEFPLTHARIGYRNVLKFSDVVQSSTDSGSDLLSLFNDFTNERWVYGGGPALIFEDSGEVLSSNNYFAVAAHNLGSVSSSITLSGSNDGVNWTTVSSSNPASDDPIMMLFESQSWFFWRVTFSGQSLPQIGVMRLGTTLDMQRPIYGGHAPVTLNRSITKREAVTEAGQFVGNVVVRRGFRTTYNWQNLSAGWYRSQFDPFARHALTKPFFIAWRPLDYPTEVAFGMATDQPRPQNQGVRDLMSVSMQVRGLG